MSGYYFKVVYNAQECTKGYMFKRNRHFEDNGSVCVCHLIKEDGGTPTSSITPKKAGDTQCSKRQM